MNRRRFLSSAATAAVAFPHLLANAREGKARVAVIGHTGRGDYGHGIDTVWLRLEEVEMVAVADANADGLARAKQRLRIDAGYADYRAMLKEARPEMVAVCPRHPDQHRDMVLAAIEAGAKGIYVEKPFCRSPEEADQLVAACRSRGVRLAVAHRNRYHPVLKAIDGLIAGGGIGRVLELRGRGKGDGRGGAEDLWVLGSHVLNLVHYFGGPAVGCSAMMRQDGRPVTGKDVREGNEALGLLAGNEVHARYELERGIVAYFDSIANDGTRGAGFGLQIIGSEGIVAIHCDRTPVAHLVPGNPFQPDPAKPRPWVPFSSAGPGQEEPLKEMEELVAHHVIPARDLIAAVREGREPLCSVHEGAMTVEMICGVFESHRQGGRRVEIPLKERRNALGLF